MFDDLACNDRVRFFLDREACAFDIRGVIRKYDFASAKSSHPILAARHPDIVRPISNFFGGYCSSNFNPALVEKCRCHNPGMTTELNNPASAKFAQRLQRQLNPFTMKLEIV